MLEGTNIPFSILGSKRVFLCRDAASKLHVRMMLSRMRLLSVSEFLMILQQ
jgi:hypothetical protein